MNAVLPPYAIALSKTKIEFFQKKVEAYWSVADRIDLEALNEALISDEIALYAGLWHEETDEILLWLPAHICYQYSFTNPKSDDAIFAEFMREKRVSHAEIAIFSAFDPRKKEYNYLAVEREALDSAIAFAEGFGFHVKGLAITPSSSTFPVPKLFPIESWENIGTDEDEAEEIVASDAVGDDLVLDEPELEPEMVANAPLDVPDIAEDGDDGEAEFAEEATPEEPIETPFAINPKSRNFMRPLAAGLVILVGLTTAQLSFSKWGPMVPHFWENNATEEVTDGDVADGDAPLEVASLDTGNQPISDATALDAPLDDEAISDLGENADADLSGAIDNEGAAEQGEIDIPVAPDGRALEPEGQILDAPPPRDADKIAALKKRLDARAETSSGAPNPNSFDLGSLTLIGIYGPQGKPQAMIRSPEGGIHTVKKGAKVDGWDVVAISRSEVIVSKGGNQLRLTVPN